MYNLSPAPRAVRKMFPLFFLVFTRQGQGKPAGGAQGSRASLEPFSFRSVSEALGIEQQEHGIELQSARKHVKHKNILGRQRQGGKVGSRADGGQSGAYVVEGRRHSRKDSLQ